jgi:hypothetical protein
MSLYGRLFATLASLRDCAYARPLSSHPPSAYLQGWRAESSVPGRSVAADEELTYSYCPLDYAYNVRQSILQNNYGFRCQCSVCATDKRHYDEKKVMSSHDATDKRHYDKKKVMSSHDYKRWIMRSLDGSQPHEAAYNLVSCRLMVAHEDSCQRSTTTLTRRPWMRGSSPSWASLLPNFTPIATQSWMRTGARSASTGSRSPMGSPRKSTARWPRTTDSPSDRHRYVVHLDSVLQCQRLESAHHAYTERRNAVALRKSNAPAARAEDLRGFAP